MISKIWKTQKLTNDGPFVLDLERELSNHLSLDEILFVSNGTIALQLAIKSLALKGEVITTPFSFVATTSAIVWENCTPVFVDINKDTLNIDPQKIEALITSNTSAILATHVFGTPCDVKSIEIIAKKHNLKVIYDAAHAFGVKVDGKSIFEYGDISICSTHATKVFHTVEGGFLVAKDASVFTRIKAMRNFGFKDYSSFSCLGINAKNSEFHAAIGILNLKYIDKILRKRKLLSELYDKLLSPLDFIKPKLVESANKNYSFYPVILESEEVLINCVEALSRESIFTRRYFYPSLTRSLNYLKESNELPIVDDISKRVLCLPLYFDLKEDEVKYVSKVLNKTISMQNNQEDKC